MSCHPLRSDLLALFPELTPESTEGMARLDLFLNLAGKRINRCAYGELADFAQQLMAAHMLALSGRGGSGAVGAVTSERVGDLQVTYAATMGGAAGQGSLSSTTYGAQLEELSHGLAGVGAFVTD